MKKQFLLLFLLFALNGVAQSLDPTFGVNGIVNSQFSNVPSSDSCSASAIQPDGKIIVCGTSQTPNTTGRFIARLNTDGTLDTSFSTIGYKYLSLGNSQGIEKIRLLSNGKIILCSQLSILKLNADGSYDTTFGTNGTTSASFSPSDPIINKSMALQSDGKIITVGCSWSNSNRDFVLVRYNVNGSIDTTYGTNGIAQIDLGTNFDSAFDVAAQTDDKMIVTGHTASTSASTSPNMVTIRVNTDGSLNTSFGISGKVTYVTANSDSGKSIAIYPDGKIMVLVITNGHPAYFKYNVNGSLDTTFSTVGYKVDTIKMTATNSMYTQLFVTPRIILLDSGKFIASGVTYSTVSGVTENDFALKKINSDGTDDVTFGTNGFSTYSINQIDYSNFTHILSTGDIITGGCSLFSSSIYKVVFLQYNQNGIYQNSRFFNIKLSEEGIAKMIEQANGKIVVIDDTSDYFVNPKMTLRRYNTDGSPDSTFGVSGVIDTQLSCDVRVDCLIGLNNGKIAYSNMYNKYVYRTTADGILDATFGTNGLADLSTIIGGNGYIDKIKQGPDSKIYVAFDHPISGGSSYNFGVLRLLDNGTVDTTFGTNGIFDARFNYFSSTDITEFPSDLCFQSDGKIIVTGSIQNNLTTTTPSVVIGAMRLNTDGTLDTSFGTNGKTINFSSTYSRNYPGDLICLNDNKFLLNAYLSPTNATATLKFNADGSLDTSFGNNGYVYDLNYNNAMVLQTDGKILKGGNKNAHFSTTRYNANGTIDTGFGINGYLSTPINNYSSINSLLFTQNGNLIAGGFSSTDRITYATLVRYTNLNLGVLSFEGNNLLVYPNPIINETTFDYTLTNDSQISISLYDIEGKLMSEIAKDEIQTTGNHQLLINMSGYASGNYILKLTSNTGQHSIQLLKK